MVMTKGNYSIIQEHYGELDCRPSRILRVASVCQLIGISRSCLYNWLDSKSRWFIPNFPKPIKIGNAAIGWREEEIAAYLRNAPRAGDAS